MCVNIVMNDTRASRDAGGGGGRYIVTIII